MTAFEKYLLGLSAPDAAAHIIDCLMTGDSHNQAWVLMDEMLGEWSCDPKDIPMLVYQALIKLRQKAKAVGA